MKSYGNIYYICSKSTKQSKQSTLKLLYFYNIYEILCNTKLLYLCNTPAALSSSTGFAFKWPAALEISNTMRPNACVLRPL